MIFKRSTSITVESSEHRHIAEYLDQELRRLVNATPELQNKFFGPSDWRLTDRDHENSTEGKSPALLFDEFDSHELTPGRLHSSRLCWADKEMQSTYELSCSYTLGEAVRLAVEGPNRTLVDGIGATFERIKTKIESGPLPNAAPPVANISVTATNPSPVSVSAPTPAPAPASTGNQSWFAKTWRDHTATAITTLIVGVLVIAVGAWLGWN